MKRGLIGAALLPVLALLISSPARADYDPVASGATKLTLSRGFLSTLDRGGIDLAAVAPARLKGSTITFPVDGGKLDPTAGKGVVEHDGALVFRAGGRRVPLKALRLKTSQRGAPLTAKVGGSQLKLGTSRGLRVVRTGFGVTVRVDSLALSRTLASRLGKKLRRKAIFEEGEALASAVTRAEPETVALQDKGAATLTLNPDFAARLQSLFVAVNPIFPAEHSGPVFTLPILGGKIAPDIATGKVETEGALEFIQLGGGQVFWAQGLLDFEAKAATPEVEIRPSPPYGGKVGIVPVADLSLVAARSTSDPRSRTIALENAELLLTAASAQTFNEVFARPQGKDAIFAGGEVMGVVSFTASGH